MASPPARPGSPGAAGLLHGGRARSYGSLVTSAASPVRERRLEHRLAPGDTLPGLALRYGVTIEQIKRANRLYTNDSIFLKQTLYIPVQVWAKDLILQEGEGARQPPEGEEQPESQPRDGDAARAGSGPRHDLSATDFLHQLDSQISLSKEAAAKKLQEGKIAMSRAEAGAGKTVPGWNEPLPRIQQRSLLGPVPLTKTLRATVLRDEEDEIFKL
ncbi:PREDICTED: lysM and putative peptidoglycan-binding domain-containing protein 1 [Crocodylus porosus]|uniref:LysM and putative peptidoglycan-binding domain-containing protein 1 n=1 Tax=Crocodylus porosus TaxID=8502 RepID=A0A7M4EL40_CROPO|nr:PREDICTED: lysM and putative peptidoglycan-binding domain-containing protein 1 [Crocodylus porosus]